MTEAFKNELSTGLKLVAFKSVSVGFPRTALMGGVNEALQQLGWSGVSAVVEDGTALRRYYYDTAQKNYVEAVFEPATGACTFEKADENDVLEKLSFPELKHLGNLIDKKSVAFIRIYAEKEMASASTEEERRALTERNQRMIDEAEVALRKR